MKFSAAKDFVLGYREGQHALGKPVDHEELLIALRQYANLTFKYQLYRG